jgi:hypothetical protein
MYSEEDFFVHSILSPMHGPPGPKNDQPFLQQTPIEHQNQPLIQSHSSPLVMSHAVELGAGTIVVPVGRLDGVNVKDPVNVGRPVGVRRPEKDPVKVGRPVGRVPVKDGRPLGRVPVKDEDALLWRFSMTALEDGMGGVNVKEGLPVGRPVGRVPVNVGVKPGKSAGKP